METMAARVGTVDSGEGVFFIDAAGAVELQRLRGFQAFAPQRELESERERARLWEEIDVRIKRLRELEEKGHAKD
tara:strand:- start:1016 stop:1240 length:225 start_codon:yes stop_codon:yes gene_type:complete